MRLRFFIVAAVVLALFSRCEDNSDGNYSNTEIVLDNAQAVMYFHTVFCEAENIWALADSKGYVEFEDFFQQSEGYKEVTAVVTEKYDEDGIELLSVENTVTVTYHEWISNKLKLTGEISVVFLAGSYRKQNETARATLNNLFIENQNVTGVSTVQYRNVPKVKEDDEEDDGDDEEEEEEEENDIYHFSLLDGASIREAGRRAGGMPVLLTASIRNGSYERVAGGATLSADDDVWKYWGVMSGILRNRPTMRYTNTISERMNIDGTQVDFAIYFDGGCPITVMHNISGFSTITISGHSDIFYQFRCDRVYFETETHNIRD